MEKLLAQQKSETFWVFEDIKSKHGVPDLAVVEFQMVPADENARWAEFEAVISAKGLSLKRYDDGSTLEISTRPLALSAEMIWEYEEMLTRLAAEFGFLPDGWGFFGVDSGGNALSN